MFFYFIGTYVSLIIIIIIITTIIIIIIIIIIITKITVLISIFHNIHLNL